MDVEVNAEKGGPDVVLNGEDNVHGDQIGESIN